MDLNVLRISSRSVLFCSMILLGASGCSSGGGSERNQNPNSSSSNNESSAQTISINSTSPFSSSLSASVSSSINSPGMPSSISTSSKSSSISSSATSLKSSIDSSSTSSSSSDTGTMGSAVPDQVDLALSIEQTKTFVLNWQDVPSADYYQIYEDSDGDDMDYILVADSIEPGIEVYRHYVPLFRMFNARYKVASCNTFGCSMSENIKVEGNLVEGIGYFKAGNTIRNDHFGHSVDISDDGKIMVVGAIVDNGTVTGVNAGDESKIDEPLNANHGSGAVYVFNLSESGWEQMSYIKDDEQQYWLKFGQAVKISGDGKTIAVGMDDDRVSVYKLMDEDGGQVWRKDGSLKPSNILSLLMFQSSRGFGKSLALSFDGNTLAVGDPEEVSSATGVNGNSEDASYAAAGAVFLFERVDGSWVETAYIKASNTRGGNRFGYAIDISSDGEVLAVGAPQEDGGSTEIDGSQEQLGESENVGAVYIFSKSEQGWVQDSYLKPSVSVGSSEFGYALSVSGDGKTVVCSARTISSVYSGSVFVFENAGDGWSESTILAGPNTEELDYFGSGIDISETGEIIAIAAYGERSEAKGVNGNQEDNSKPGSGAAYVFEKMNDEWTFLSYLKPTVSGIQFGKDNYDSVPACPLAISGDGLTIAVGATDDDSDSSGINGDDFQDVLGENVRETGAVFVY